MDRQMYCIPFLLNEKVYPVGVAHKNRIIRARQLTFMDEL